MIVGEKVEGEGYVMMKRRDGSSFLLVPPLLFVK